MLAVFPAHRIDTEQVRLDSQQIAARHARVSGVRKCRKVGVSVRVGAVMKCLHEIVIGPAADPGFPVGRDIGRVKGTERRLERTAARKRHGTLFVNRVAGNAPACVRQVFTQRLLRIEFGMCCSA